MSLRDTLGGSCEALRGCCAARIAKTPSLGMRNDRPAELSMGEHIYDSLPGGDVNLPCVSASALVKPARSSLRRSTDT